MVRPRQKNIVTRLADAGEEAIQRLGGAPGADRLGGAVNTLRERMDEMQRRMLGLEEVQKRLESIERRLDKLEGKGSPSSSSRSRSSASSPRPKKIPPST
jgi:hypothetical protein